MWITCICLSVVVFAYLYACNCKNARGAYHVAICWSDSTIEGGCAVCILRISRTGPDCVCEDFVYVCWAIGPVMGGSVLVALPM